MMTYEQTYRIREEAMQGSYFTPARVIGLVDEIERQAKVIEGYKAALGILRISASVEATNATAACAKKGLLPAFLEELWLKAIAESGIEVEDHQNA